MTHYIHGWNRASLETQLTHEPDEPLRHIAADSYGSIVPGDVLWIVGIGAQKVTLYFRFEVQQQVGQAEAERIFNEALWKARFHFVGKGTAPLWQDITPILPDLEFVSKTSPRLVFDRVGHFSNQAFRVPRHLTPASQQILEPFAWTPAPRLERNSHAGAPIGEANDYADLLDDFVLEGPIELVARHGVRRREGYIYFIGEDLDIRRISDEGDDKPEVVSSSKGGQRDPHFFYFMNNDGDIARLRRIRLCGLPLEAPQVLDILHLLGTVVGPAALLRLCEMKGLPRLKRPEDQAEELSRLYRGDLRSLLSDLRTEDLRALVEDGLLFEGSAWTIPDAVTLDEQSLRARVSAFWCALDKAGWVEKDVALGDEEA